MEKANAAIASEAKHKSMQSAEVERKPEIRLYKTN
jgi:hypothetical protein